MDYSCVPMEDSLKRENNSECAQGQLKFISMTSKLQSLIFIGQQTSPIVLTCTLLQ